MPPRPRVPRGARAVLYILFVACLTELGSWAVEARLASRGIVYEPVDPRGYAAYLAKRDPVLGWPAHDATGFDPSGSRPEPAFPDWTAPACGSLYGDSFTYGFEVSDEAAWGNLLAQRLGCRVANFGGVGYGTDQAYLRFRTTGGAGDFVVLGYLSENIVRNVTRNLGFLYPKQSYALKPRFVADDRGKLDLVPLPDLTPAAFRELVAGSSASFDHEDLLPGTAFGAVLGGFPHTLSVLSALGNFRVRARLAGRAFWEDFYREDHPTHALQITRAIMNAFAREVRAQHRTPVIVFFPMYFDVVSRQRGRPWCYQALADELRAEGIAVVDAGDALVRDLHGRDPDTVYSATRAHLNEEGNRVVAAELVRALQRANVHATASATARLRGAPH
jgi:hypothetical protein